MARFQSREEYERWRASQDSGAAPDPAADGQAVVEEQAASGEQVYDGPHPNALSTTFLR